MITIEDGFEVPKLNQSSKRKLLMIAKWKALHQEKVRAGARSYYERNKEKMKEYSRNWQRANKEQFQEYSRKWRIKNKERMRDLQAKWNYNLTLGQINEQFEAQHRQCAICKKLMNKPRIDHCHKTKAFRGILCHNCNVILGLAHDSPEILRNAAIYLEKKILGYQ